MKSDATILKRRLEALDFFAAYSLLGDGNFRPYDWEKMAGQLPADLQAIWRFLLLGSPLTESQLRRLLGKPALASLMALGICQDHSGAFTLGSLSLVRYLGSTFLVDRGATPKAYFGDDTRALMTLLPQREAGRCLSLFPHSTVAVLPLAYRSPMEFTFARGPHHPAVIRANLLLNEAQGPHEVRASITARDKSRYDVIVAACPSTFEPPGVKMPPVVAGGRDGRKHLRDLLATAQNRLTDGGSLLTTFLFFGEANSNAIRATLAELCEPCKLGYRLLLCSKHLMQPGVPVFNMLFSLASAGKASAAEAIAKKMLKHVQTMKYEAAYLVKGRFFRAAPPVSQAILDYSDLYYGSWTF